MRIPCPRVGEGSGGGPSRTRPRQTKRRAGAKRTERSHLINSMFRYVHNVACATRRQTKRRPGAKRTRRARYQTNPARRNVRLEKALGNTNGRWLMGDGSGTPGRSRRRRANRGPGLGRCEATRRPSANRTRRARYQTNPARRKALGLKGSGRFSGEVLARRDGGAGPAPNEAKRHNGQTASGLRARADRRAGVQGRGAKRTEDPGDSDSKRVAIRPPLRSRKLFRNRLIGENAERPIGRIARRLSATGRPSPRPRSARTPPCRTAGSRWGTGRAGGASSASGPCSS
jgi:hypothetical protein